MYQDISNICLIFNAQTLQNQSTDLPKSQLLMLKLVVFFVVIPAFVFFLGHFILTSWYSGSLNCLYLLMPTVGTNFWSNLIFAPIPPMLMLRPRKKNLCWCPGSHLPMEPRHSPSTSWSLAGRGNLKAGTATVVSRYFVYLVWHSLSSSARCSF